MKTKVYSVKLNLNMQSKTKTEKVEISNIQKSLSEKEEVYHLPGMVVVQFRVRE
jgi:hypothetical protein